MTIERKDKLGRQWFTLSYLDRFGERWFYHAGVLGPGYLSRCFTDAVSSTDRDCIEQYKQREPILCRECVCTRILFVLP